jgi:GNAT superfamily N-acetyltransferase
VKIETGYHPGIIGRCIEMHATYYARETGFGAAFEATVAAALAEFFGRIDSSVNGFWRAVHSEQILGTVAIDGEDLSPSAHLRWFIVGDGLRGQGVGRGLLLEAIAFCERQNFHDMQLWTFRGLDAARRLYEANGFALAEERPGRQWGEKVMEQRFVRPLQQK